MHVNKLRKNILLIPILYLVSILYRIVTDLRNLFYKSGLFKIHRFNIPIISVGNITTGGTGKTPFIIYLIEQLSASYKNIAVVSRGYGRESKGLHIVSDGKRNIISAILGGDEPVLIARKFSNIVVIVSEDRKKGIEIAINKFNSDLILLDDAFQHRKVHRDCDIVLVNANYPVNEEKLLPSGNLREGKNNISRADIIIITKVDKPGNYNEQIEYYKKFKEDVFLSKCINSDINIMKSNSTQNSVDLKGDSVIAFSGIADPDSFKFDLQNSEIILKDFLDFKDHKLYRKNDIDKIINIAEKHNCINIVTTEKDFVKLNMKDFENYNLYVVSKRIEVINEEMFLEKLKRCIDSTA
jgi:tetraacyldisaccharide 4'-kinase